MELTWHTLNPPLENIKLKLFYIKNSKRSSIEMWNVSFGFLYPDVDKYGHAGISFLTKMY